MKENLCVNCKKRIATVFITRVDINGNQMNEGLCLVCAKKLKIPQVEHFFDKMGISEDELESITEEMTDMMGTIEGFSEGEGLETLEHSTNAPDIFSLLKKIPEKGDKKTKEGKDQEEGGQKKLRYLSQYASNLNLKAEKEELDKVIGREKEIDRVIQILNRRTKNNPVLLGEPGVGKTAIAEGLAVKIVEGKVPQKLKDMKIYLLDLTAMVAGTQFRGQFEARMKGVIDEVKSQGDIILVIDELHNIMGVGEAEGSLNAANILKPALSRGEIQVIGATTLEDYRKRIEKDGALERRFQPVKVDEPTIEETIEILKGLRPYYEDYHRVRISDFICQEAAKMSKRYIIDRFLPDKAIDIIDEAASRANLRNLDLIKIFDLRKEIEENQEQQTNLMAKEVSTDEESDQRYKEIAELKSQVSLLKDKLVELEKNEFIDLEFDDIAKVIENWTQIPVQTITEEEADKLLKLEERLKEKVIGQDKAVEASAKAIRRNRSGFRKRQKPSSFIFLGPTGVGKTELVKQLTLVLFGDIDSLIRLDMSEFMEKHTVSKLIGSPPGYIGYEEAGQLTEKVRRKPYSVILLDEIEKAHMDVFNMLLQILDDGRLTDSHGRTVSFENTIIIMTSNAGNSIKSNKLGFVINEDQAMEDKANDALKKIFRPEFLNRVDDIVIFNRLDKASLKKIASLMLVEVVDACKNKGLSFSISDKAIDYLVEHGYHDKYGARPLRRLIQKTIEDELSELHLKGELEKGKGVYVDIKSDELIVKVK